MRSRLVGGATSLKGSRTEPDEVRPLLAGILKQLLRRSFQVTAELDKPPVGGTPTSISARDATQSTRRTGLQKLELVTGRLFGAWAGWGLDNQAFDEGRVEGAQEG
jgi:hypothetical protein